MATRFGLFRSVKRDGGRLRMWPIRLRWAPRSASGWFMVHGWERAADVVSLARTSFGMMPGFRQTWGWTFHLGRLKVCFG